MRKFAIAIAAAAVLVVAGLLAWKAEATTMGVPAVTNHFSPIEKVGCRGWGKCPLGYYWACGPYRCWCAPCGYKYRYRY